MPWGAALIDVTVTIVSQLCFKFFNNDAKKVGRQDAKLRNFARHKPLMNQDYEEKRPLTKEEREAKKVKAREEAVKAIAARKKDDEAFRANFERLKAERLAREIKS